MTSIVMPKMGYDMTEGKVARWLKHEGDTVRKGEVIAEIETDKVTIEMESTDDGVLQRIVAPEGAATPVGAPIAVLAAPDEFLVSADRSPIQTSATAPGLPSSATSLDSSAQDSDNGSSTPRGATPAHTPAPASSTGDRDRDMGASPLARRLAREHGVDLSAINGSGPGGRITREDVLAAATGAGGGAPAPAVPAPAGSPPAPARAGALAATAATDRETEAPTSSAALQAGGRSAPDSPGAAQPGEQLLTRLQQTMGRRMVESKTRVPHFYLTVEVDMTAAAALRAEINVEGGDTVDDGVAVKISVNDLVVKATARALAHFPMLNASFAGDRLVLHDEIAIAIAVAIEDGLVTPVVHDAGHKSVAQIARETRALAARARAGTGRAGDYEGGTFTVSNLGMLGVDTFVAIINPPQAAILAVGAVRRVPVYAGEELVPRERMSVTLSADHRVTDGATGARFLAAVRESLEHPARLLL